MAPLEGHRRRPTVHLQHLPRKRGHHALKRLMAGAKIQVLRIIVLVRGDERIVRADAQHVVSILGRTAVCGECVAGVVDGAPVCEGGLEGCFDFPVFDEVFDEGRERAGRMGLGFSCMLGLDGMRVELRDETCLLRKICGSLSSLVPVHISKRHWNPSTQHRDQAHNQEAQLPPCLSPSSNFIELTQSNEFK